MLHTFDLNKVFTKEDKNDIIEMRTEKYITRYGMLKKDARKRAQDQMMPLLKYKRFAKLASSICKIFNLETNVINLDISTNRNGEHSWYIYIPIPMPFYQANNDVSDYGFFVHSEVLAKLGSREEYIQYHRCLRVRISDHTTCISDSVKIDYKSSLEDAMCQIMHELMYLSTQSSKQIFRIVEETGDGGYFTENFEEIRKMHPLSISLKDSVALTQEWKKNRV